jgi:hypothetical protein
MYGGELVGTGVEKGVAVGISRVFVGGVVAVGISRVSVGEVVAVGISRVFGGEVAGEARIASGRDETAWQARRKIATNTSRRRMRAIIAVSIVAIAGIASR